jgi:hypothetical protein
MPPGILTFDVVNNVAPDSTPPVISGLSVTPAAADVTDGAVTVTADFTVSDTGSGLYTAQFQSVHRADASGPFEDHYVDAEMVAADPNGNPGDGRYHASFVLPAGSAPGLWVTYVSAQDMEGNSSAAVSPPVYLTDRNPITALPRVVDGSLTPSPTGGAPTLSLHLTSPADIVTTSVGVGLLGPHGQTTDSGLLLSSGTRQDGVWSYPLNLPAGALAGTWSVNEIGFWDALGRLITINATDSPVLAGLSWTTN